MRPSNSGLSSVVTCVLVIALLSPLPSQAQNTTEVRAAIASVNRLYESLEYELALEQIASARRLPRSMEDDVTLALYEGLVLADMSRWDEAAAAFKFALVRQPEAKLPVKASPQVRKRFEAVRQQVKAEHQAQSESIAPESLRPDTMSGGKGRRARVLLPTIAGGVLLIAGGVSYGLARSEQSKLVNNDPSFTTGTDVRASISRGKTYQAVGFGLLGAGVVGLGVATGLFLLGTKPESVALGVSTDGTSTFVYGRWP